MNTNNTQSLSICRTLLNLLSITHLTFILTAYFLPCASTAKSDRPNIVFVLADDLGWSDVGYHGSPYYETPRIDEFAMEGMRFSDAYVAAPNCAPARASLLFGQYPSRTGNYEEMGAPSVRSLTDNKPLRGGKSTQYGGGVRILLAIRWPGVIKLGTLSRIPVTSVDFFPTFLEIVGGNSPKDHPLDGTSILPTLKQEELPIGRKYDHPLRLAWTPYTTAHHVSNPQNKGEQLFNYKNELLSGQRLIFWHFPLYYGNRLEDPAWANTPCSAVRVGRFKLIEFFEDNRLELYDLVQDIGKQNNLVNAYPRIRDELYSILQKWQKDTDAFIP